MNIFMDAASFLLWVTLVKAHYRDFSFKKSLKLFGSVCFVLICVKPQENPQSRAEAEVVPT